MGRILIKNGKVWNGEKFFFADVLTDNDKIRKISEHINENADFVFDAEGCTVSPGLIDIHAHLEGISSEAFGIQAEMCCMPFGTTAAVDASGTYGDKNLLDSFSLKNLVFVGSEIKNNTAYTDNTEKMLKKFGDKAVGIKVYFDKNVSDIKDIKPLKEIIEFAEKNNLIIMVHSSNSPIPMKLILNNLRKGDILTHAFHGGENNVSDDNYECILHAQERGIIIDTGFAGFVHTDFSIFQNAIANGAIPDTISSDITKLSAYKRGGRYGMTMCMSMAKTLGMNEESIFRAVTSAPAKVLNKDSQWGTLSVGRCADIAVLSYTNEAFDLTDNAGNNVHSSLGYRCKLTVCNGEVVYKD